jgi:NADH:ubiquinone oxidoreductase subunit 6 (subunit J)
MIRIIALAVAAIALILVVIMLFGKSQKPWNEMTNDEQKRKKVLVAGSLGLFIAGLITALLTGKKK